MVFPFYNLTLYSIQQRTHHSPTRVYGNSRSQGREASYSRNRASSRNTRPKRRLLLRCIAFSDCPGAQVSFATFTWMMLSTAVSMSGKIYRFSSPPSTLSSQARARIFDRLVFLSSWQCADVLYPLNTQAFGDYYPKNLFC